jgi:predicted lactoylglutathione lyase
MSNLLDDPKVAALVAKTDAAARKETLKALVAKTKEHFETLVAAAIEAGDKALAKAHKTSSADLVRNLKTGE